MHWTTNSKTNIRKTKVRSTSKSRLVDLSTRIHKSGKKSAKSKATNMTSRKVLLRLICRHVGTASCLMYSQRLVGSSSADGRLIFGVQLLLLLGATLGLWGGTWLVEAGGTVGTGVIIVWESGGGPGVPIGPGGVNKLVLPFSTESITAPGREISEHRPFSPGGAAEAEGEGGTLGTMDGWLSGKRKLLMRLCLSTEHYAFFQT